MVMNTQLVRMVNIMNKLNKVLALRKIFNIDLRVYTTSDVSVRQMLVSEDVSVTQILTDVVLASLHCLPNLELDFKILLENITSHIKL